MLITVNYFYFQYSFIGYSDYEYVRCLVDICENSTDAIFDNSFVNFTLPPVIDGEDNSLEDHACMMYQVIDPTQGCVADNFNQSHQIACSQHVFSPDVPYAYSLVEEMDLPSCTQAGNWPLKVNVNIFL